MKNFNTTQSLEEATEIVKEYIHVDNPKCKHCIK